MSISDYQYAKFLIESGRVSGIEKILCEQIVNNKGNYPLSNNEKALLNSLINSLQCDYCGEILQSDELDAREELVCSRCRNRLANIMLE